MRPNQTRRQIVANAVQARRPPRSGGTQAPNRFSRGPRAGLGPGRPAKGGYRAGLGPAHPAGAGGRPGPSTLAPGVAAPSGPAPTPWNSKAEQIVAGARRNYLNAQGNFDLAESEAKQDYGLDPGFNDYKANPYSRAALLEQSYQNANRGTLNSAGLQLYSGSTSNALSGNRSTFDFNKNALANSYREALGEITQGRTKAAEEKAEAEQQAEWDRISAAEAVEPDPETAPSGGGSGSKPQRKRKRKRKGK